MSRRPNPNHEVSDTLDDAILSSGGICTGGQAAGRQVL
jgi:hypothetical protein